METMVWMTALAKGMAGINIPLYIEAILWLVALVVFIVIEILTTGLISIWLAAGALVSFFVALAGFNIWVQLGVFFVVSILLLLFTKPVVQKRFNKDTVKTNAEGLIGRTAKVTSTINNIEGTGTVFINGLEWTARVRDDAQIIPEGTIVTIEEISGVKLIVSK